MTAKLVSIEGADGLGKTTQIALVADALRAVGKRVAVAKMPRYERPTGRLIRRMLRDGRAMTWPNAFQVAQWLDKILFQLLVLPALLRSNDYVLLDRWHVSMRAYGLASGASETLTETLVDLVRSPDMTLVFQGRSKRASAHDAYETSSSLQKSVTLSYVLWVCAHDEAVAIDADLDRERVTADCLDAILSLDRQGTQ